MSGLVCRCGHPQFAHAALNGLGMCAARETVPAVTDLCLCPAFREDTRDVDRTGFCEFHGEPEPVLPSDYRSCGECGHRWRSESDFRRDMLKLFGSLLSTIIPEPQDVYSCPLCAHDW